MDFFEKDGSLSDDSLHPKFKVLRDEIGYYGARMTLSDWAVGFYDRDNKAREEFQKTFHSTFWEIYLHAVFKAMNFKVSDKHNRPDFILKKSKEFYVEAVVSEIKKNGVPESLRTIEDNEKNLRPISTRSEFSKIIDEAIIRHSNSIQKKLNSYTGYEKKGKWVKGYIDCDWVSQDSPYIIALASYDQISYGREFIYSMFALLYGYYFDPETKLYAKRTSIKKNGTDSDINLGLFTNSSLKEVSAIIFCNTLTLGKLSSIYRSSHVNFDTVLNVRYIVEEPHYRVQEVSPDNPEQLFDGLYLFHNPNAVNKLDPDLFNGVAQFSLDERGPHQIGNYPLIVSRYHTNMLPSNLLPTLKDEVFYNFNPEYCNRMINKESNEKRENNNSGKNRKKKRKMVKMARRKNR